MSATTSTISDNWKVYYADQPKRKVFVCYEYDEAGRGIINQIVFKHRIQADRWVRQRGGRTKADYDELEMIS